jgi:hypothetical protein
MASDPFVNFPFVTFFPFASRQNVSDIPVVKSRVFQHARRDGPFFVVSPEAALPQRCVKCNAECSSLRISRRISTLSAWYPLFASAGWNAHCADDLPIHIPYGLCLRHRLECLGRAALIGLFGLGNILCFAIFNFNPKLSPTIDLLAILLPVPLLAVALTIRPVLRPRRVHHGLAWFSGAGPEFLNSLPEIDAGTVPTALSLSAGMSG